MKNSLDDTFLGLVEAVMQDMIAYDPTLHRGLIRDLSRVRSLTLNMGSRIFTEFLPALRKQLDIALSSGSLCLSGPLTRPYSSKTRIPRLFKGIWGRLFKDSGMRRQSIDVNIVLLFRTLLNAANKYEADCPDSATFSETREFYRNDVSLPPPSQIWDGDGNIDSSYQAVHLRDLLGSTTDQPDLFGPNNDTDTKLLDTIQRVADIVSSSFGEFTPSEAKFRHGPGAVSEGLRGREKYLPVRWSQRLERIFPALGNSIPLGWEYPHDDREIPSRLLAVPKTIKGPRLIACEPSDHLWCQFSIMEFLVDSVKRSVLSHCLQFDSQEPSRQAALRASINGDSVTIDLKSASDRISCWLVERMFRKNHSLLSAMVACRTRYVDLSIDKKLPSVLKLRKFTTQGSALTFPVQSIIFSIIAISSLVVNEVKIDRRTIARAAKQVRIFGDDIIVPKEGFEATKRGLEGLYLRINAQKTHVSGEFRESCGMDALGGYDVTPPGVNRLDVKTDMSSVTSIVEASNNFFTKGLWNAADYLVRLIPRGVVNSIPVRKSPDMPITLRSYSGNYVHQDVKSRWNADYQIEERQVLVQRARVKPFKVDGSRQLVAFLAARENEKDYSGRPSDLFKILGLIEPLSLLSRWESRPVVGRAWVQID